MPCRRPSTVPSLRSPAFIPGKPVLRPMALALKLAFAGSLLAGWSAAAQAQPPAVPAAEQTQSGAGEGMHRYDIAAGALSTALTQFSAEAGILLVGATDLAQGKNSPGVRGTFSTQAALDALLAGTGLEAVRNAQGQYVLQAAGSESRTLAPVLVEENIIPASNDPGRTEGSSSYAAPSTNTAFKLPLTPRETPQTVTVVPQAAIKDFALTDIRKILLFTPGVHVSAERGPQAYYFQARGQNMQVQFDGVPSSNRFGGRGDGMTFDSATIDRIEVLHGAAGLLTGPGSPGGTINVIRKLPTEKAQTTLEAGGDSWGGWRGMADVSGPLGDSGLTGRLVSVYERQDSYVDYASGKHSMIYGVLGKHLGEHTELYAGINLEQVTDASYGSHYGLPANIDGTLLDIPREKNLGATWADQDDTLNTVFLRLQHAFSPDWTLHGIFTYEDYDTHQLESVAARPREAAEVNNIYLYPAIENWHANTQALDLYLQGRFGLLGRQHDLMFGFNGARKDSGGDYSTSPAPLATIDIETWDARQAPGPYSQGMDYIFGWSGEYEQYGVFGGTRFNLLDPLHLIVGTRLSWVEQSFDGVTDSKEDGISTWYGGLVWDLTKHLSAYTSYSDIFEPHWIGTRDRNGAVLDPITGENLEAGLKLEAFGGKLNGAFALFRLDQTNLAETDLEGEAPGICGGTLDLCSKATGLIRSEGFELSLAGEVANGWQVMAGYTKFTRDRRDGEIDPYDAKTPEQQLHVATTYTAPDSRWSIGASARWQEATVYRGDLFFMPEQSFRIEQKAYTVVGLFGGYQLTPTLRLSAAVDNLFDETYLSGLEWPIGGLVYGDPRRVSVTLRAEF